MGNSEGFGMLIRVQEDMPTRQSGVSAGQPPPGV